MGKGGSDSFRVGRQGKLTLLATDYSFVTIAYVTRKFYPEEELRRLLKGLMRYVEVVEVGKEIIGEALDGGWKDMEDHVQCLVAKRESVDAIITRNEKDFALSDIRVLSPSGFLSEIL